MALGPDFMRPMRAGEEPAVAALLDQAFGSTDESRLVQGLRASRAMAGEIVMPMGEGIVGYYALSYLVEPKGWLALAPVAIAPAQQGHRHGSRMIRFLGAWAQASGASIVVLGKVSFYARAGFSNARAAGFQTDYPLEHLMLLAPGTDAPHVKLVYPSAFKGI